MTSQAKGSWAAILVIAIPIIIVLVAYKKSETVRGRIDSMSV
jgi:hypothetical protein